MHYFIFFIKTQVNVLNLLIILLLLAYFFRYCNKRKIAVVFFSLSLLFFLLSSTNYLPNYYAVKLEQKYSPLDIPANSHLKNTKLLIHVLGNGYSLNKNLPPNAQLGLGSLARLAEAIRINRLLDSSKIICSADGPPGAETQAEVTRRAAIALGVDSNRIDILSTPSTTSEEAQDLAKKFGTITKVIVVTDAMHMPRAIKIFKSAGFQPIAAPTNFKASEGSYNYWLGWLPAIENINLMDRVIHEYLATIHSSF